jgi:UPF0755 protein
MNNKYRRRRLVVVASALVVAALIVGYLNRGVIRNAWDVISGADYSGTGHGEVTLVIHEGDDGAVIAQELVDLGVVKSYRSVYKLLIAKDQTFYPGTYKLKLEMSSNEALSTIANPASRVSNKVTIKEGWRITKVLSELSAKTGIALSDLKSAAANLSGIGVPASEVSAEGWLFPATYDFNPGITAREVLRQMVQRMHDELDRYGVQAKDAHRVLTLSALIQAEARIEADFYKVSRVFLNRIANGMRLQSDATVSYGVNGKTVSTSAADRANSNGYNTYLHDGLPIGPISAPGTVAIDAALHPAAGKWLYFCAVNLKTGETVFSETYAQHAVAVTQWRKWMSENPGYE